MSPRRLFATAGTMAELRPLLKAEVAKVPAVRLGAGTAPRLRRAFRGCEWRARGVQGSLRPESAEAAGVDARLLRWRLRAVICLRR